MGLYDTVRCKYTLPQPKGVDLSDFAVKLEDLIEFQTKDLGKGMALYEIREDGSLWTEKYSTRYVDDPEYKKKMLEIYKDTFPDTSELDFKRPEKYDVVWVPYFVHNHTVRIYELYSPEENCKFEYWIEYKVTFSNSVVSNIELEKFEKKERVDPNKLFEILEPSMVEKFVKFVFDTWRKLISKLPSSYSVENWIRNRL
jgi:hypothetical protein